MAYRLALKSDIPQIMKIVDEAQEFIKNQGFNQWQDGYPDEGAFLADISGGCCHVFCEAGRTAESGL